MVGGTARQKNNGGRMELDPSFCWSLQRGHVIVCGKLLTRNLRIGFMTLWIAEGPVGPCKHNTTTRQLYTYIKILKRQNPTICTRLLDASRIRHLSNFLSQPPHADGKYHSHLVINQWWPCLEKFLHQIPWLILVISVKILQASSNRCTIFVKTQMIRHILKCDNTLASQEVERMGLRPPALHDCELEHCVKTEVL
ncbi:hypothetical protein PIB30_028867 [Stylosanthes scabra]|uniref:Uncharacterized protein n=1 Tax=Stylosanthes scabra TaxID=79078 RepID=A0ABU6WBD6_9FABA|nr:hypothetical protein [Stylosanthes scabra]